MSNYDKVEDLAKEIALVVKAGEVRLLVERSQERLRNAIQKLTDLLVSVCEGSAEMDDRCCLFVDAATKSIYEASNKLLGVTLTIVAKHDRGLNVESDMDGLKEMIRKAIAEVDALSRLIEAGGPS